MQAFVSVDSLAAVAGMEPFGEFRLVPAPEQRREHSFRHVACGMVELLLECVATSPLDWEL